MVGNAAAGFVGAMAGTMVTGAVSNPFDQGGYVDQQTGFLDGGGYDHEPFEDAFEPDDELDDEFDGDFDGGDFF